jgi:lipopolysaccharide export system ATP-binding protein
VLETKSVLRAEGLRKVYKQRVVVKGSTLAVNQGEVVGLLGPNGAGKTTTFYMIVGMVPPDKGRVYLDDQDITTMAMYRRARNGIAYLPQEPCIFRRLSVEQNIMAVLQLTSMT